MTVLDEARRGVEQQEVFNARFAAGLSEYTQGTCVSVDWVNSLVSVNIGGGQLSIPMVSRAPFPGDRVWVGYLGGLPFCLGAIPKSSTATVTGSPTGGRVDVTADDGRVYTVPYDQAYTPTVGHRVVLDWSANGVLTCRMSAEPAGVIPSVPLAPPTPVGGSAVFGATDSATWRGGWADNLFGVSDSRSGFYFYGTQIRDTIPDSSPITGFALNVAEDWNRLTNVTLTLHPDASRGGSQPGAIDTFTVAGGSGAKALPLGWAASLRDGSAFGIGSIQGSGWLQWQSSATSGALSISWG